MINLPTLEVAILSSLKRAIAVGMGKNGKLHIL
jgi:hypothetical protein